MIGFRSFNKYSSVSVNTTLRIKMAEKRMLEHFGFTTSASKKQKTQELHGESSKVVEKEKKQKERENASS